MADISLKHFVDINIQPSVEPVIKSTRKTAVLFTTSGNDGTANMIHSITEADTTYPSTTFAGVNAMLHVFFDNGGIQVNVVEGASTDKVQTKILNLANEYIVLAFDGLTAAQVETVALAINAKTYGINEKLFLTRVTSTDNAKSIKNLIYKYSTTVGAEMTIAAYLTQIDVYKSDSVKDYMFTQELIDPETLTDLQYEAIIHAQMNVDIALANSIRNCGGNCSDGNEVTNEFVRIVLHQTLTDRLVELLVQKIKGNSGIAQIYAVICDELERYVNNGYLTRDKAWTLPTLTKVGADGVEYTIIEQNTALPSGFYVSILPFTALSTDDRTMHKAPPIYVILADQYGIRAITIEGEVI